MIDISTEGSESVARCLADFAGCWQIRRNITPRDGPGMLFEGQAEWTAAGQGFNYRETGTMQIAGQPAMQAERRYYWAEDLSVYFDDGRFFHRVPASGGQAQHWCAPDRYLLTYDFREWPMFRVLWHVMGPKKDYKAETVYIR